MLTIFLRKANEKRSSASSLLAPRSHRGERPKNAANIGVLGIFVSFPSHPLPISVGPARCSKPLHPPLTHLAHASTHQRASLHPSPPRLPPSCCSSSSTGSFFTSRARIIAHPMQVMSSSSWHTATHPTHTHPPIRPPTDPPTHPPAQNTPSQPHFGVAVDVICQLSASWL